MSIEPNHGSWSISSCRNPSTKRKLGLPARLGTKVATFFEGDDPVSTKCIDGFNKSNEDPSRGKIRRAIVDDHPPFRDALRTVLSSDPDIETVAELGNGRGVLRMILERKPDVLLLDLMMPEVDGISALKQIQESPHDVKTIVLTESDDEGMQILAMKLGASGYVVKTSEPDLLVEAIRKVNEGEIRLDSQGLTAVMQAVVEREDAAVALSVRQRVIVWLLCQGLTNREIGARLFICEQTVKSHLHRVFRKVGVANRLQLVQYAIQSNMQLRPNPGAGVLEGVPTQPSREV